MQKSMVLIIEDAGITAEDILGFLNDLSYSVSSIARTDSETLISIIKEKPDLVLMDTVLRNDHDCIKTIRSIQNRFDIPTFLETDLSISWVLERAMVLG